MKESRSMELLFWTTDEYESCLRNPTDVRMDEIKFAKQGMPA